jgi:hypothetical protein
MCVAGFFDAPKRRNYPATKENMSTKTDCLAYLKSKLENEFTKLIVSGSNLPATQTIHRLVSTADNIDDGFFAQIEPSYEPLTPKFLSTVQTLNNAIVGGSSTPANFDGYVKSLATALLT